MQSTKRVDDFVSRTQIEVISISKEDLDAEFLKDVLWDSLDRPGSPYGHEDRRFDLAMSRVDPTQASSAIARLNFEVKRHWN